MTDDQQSWQVQANEERDAERKERETPDGVAGTLGMAINSILSPLSRDGDSAEEREEQRELNDAEQRDS